MVKYLKYYIVMKYKASNWLTLIPRHFGRWQIIEKVYLTIALCHVEFTCRSRVTRFACVPVAYNHILLQGILETHVKTKKEKYNEKMTS